MTEYPTLDDLYWLFEIEPVLTDPDLGWPISEAKWTTSRGAWRIMVRACVYEQTVEIRCDLAGTPAIHVKLVYVIDHLVVDRTSGRESLVVTPIHSAGLHPVRLTLKPTVSVHLENRSA